MYKVLLVDDESIDLQWLVQSIPWHELELEIFKIVNSSVKALEILKTQKIDLLISDIKMPIMTGLEMVKQIRTFNSELKVIFVSGHEDFRYAKEAIAMNASGYVLKPVDMEEMIKLLKSIVESIRQEKIYQIEKKEFEANMAMVKSEVIFSWLNGKEGTPAIKLLKNSGINFRGKIASVSLITIDDIKVKMENDIITQPEEAKLKVMNVIANYIKEKKINYYYVDRDNNTTIINNDWFRKKTVDSLNGLIIKIYKETGFTVTIGMGDCVNNYEGLKSSYRRAKQMIEYKMYIGKDRLISKEDITEKINRKIDDFDALIEELAFMVAENKTLDITIQLKKLIDIGINDDTINSFNHYTLHILYRFEEAMRRNYSIDIEELIGWDLRFYHSVYYYETTDDIYRWIKEQLIDLAHKIEDSKMSNERKLIGEIKYYIEKNIQDKLTLRTVAENFEFSPNYLGFLFKKEVGKNFTEYLVEAKLAKACELLKDPRLKVYEVAEMMGYKNLVYFNRQFKKVYGMSPSQYRKKI